MSLPTRTVSRSSGLLLLAALACNQNGAGLLITDGGDDSDGGAQAPGTLAPNPPARGGFPGPATAPAAGDAGAGMSVPPASAPPAPTGPCRQAGAGCPGAGGCCSNRCEPVTGVPRRECGAFCFGEGVSCTKAQDCCSLGCFGGKCGTHTCTVE